MSNNDLNSAHLMLAFLGGAAIGAGFAYLTAPRSGAETRQWITDNVATRREEIAKLPPALRAAYDASVEAAKAAYKDKLAAVAAAEAASSVEEEG